MARILLIEDDPLMYELYERVLSHAGYAVAVANDGIDGLKLTKSLSPDLILLDIIMPKVDGIQVLEQLKGDDSTKNIPVVMLTNVSSPEQRQRAMDKGASRYVIKSDYDPYKLMAVIKEVLGEEKAL